MQWHDQEHTAGTKLYKERMLQEQQPLAKNDEHCLLKALHLEKIHH